MSANNNDVEPKITATSESDMELPAQHLECTANDRAATLVQPLEIETSTPVVTADGALQCHEDINNTDRTDSNQETGDRLPDANGPTDYASTSELDSTERPAMNHDVLSTLDASADATEKHPRDYGNKNPDVNEGNKTTRVLIADLHPFLTSAWVLQARVISCAAPREWTSDRGRGKLLSIYLMDEKGDVMKATIFNDAVDTFLPHITVGSCCSLSKGHIRFANRAFSRDPHEINFDDRSSIAPIPADNVRLAPLRSCSTIGEIDQLPNKSIMTVLAIITKIGPEKRIATKRGQETSKRELLIVDQSSYQTVCVLWGNHAKEDISNNGGKVVFIRHAEVNDYNGNRSLNIGPQTALMFEPPLQEVDDLEQWFVAHTNDESFPFIAPSVANLPH